MGFGAKSNLGILSGHMFSSSENVFNVQDISWGYFAITAFMGSILK